MPFCTQCGKEISADARFCAGCGSPQNAGSGGPGGGPGGPNFLDTMSPRTASILCYVPILGWTACVVFLAARRFRNDRTVRFHAFQGLYLFVAWLLVDKAVKPVIRALPIDNLGIVGLLQAALVAAWIFMLVKTAHDEAFRLPVFGELADRSLAEQRS